jgi:hypothetical protein
VYHFLGSYWITALPKQGQSKERKIWFQKNTETEDKSGTSNESTGLKRKTNKFFKK